MNLSPKGSGYQKLLPLCPKSLQLGELLKYLISRIKVFWAPVWSLVNKMLPSILAGQLQAIGIVFLVGNTAHDQIKQVK